MAAANDNVDAGDRFSVRDREEAIKICAAMALAPSSRRYLSVPSVVSDLICLVLEAIGIQEMPPTAEQWRRAADNLRLGWRPR